MSFSAQLTGAESRAGDLTAIYRQCGWLAGRKQLHFHRRFAPQEDAPQTFAGRRIGVSRHVTNFCRTLPDDQQTRHKLLLDAA
jgi:hypothetical protein